MYAVIAGAGRQYCVEEGQELLVDLMDVEPGKTVEFDRVLLIGGGESGPMVGKPTVPGAKVVADVLDHVRDKKVRVRTYKRRKNFRRHKGHRQEMTRLKISQIVTAS